MCFCTIPSNGHTSLSTALVTVIIILRIPGNEGGVQGSPAHGECPASQQPYDQPARDPVTAYRRHGARAEEDVVDSHAPQQECGRVGAGNASGDVVQQGSTVVTVTIFRVLLKCLVYVEIVLELQCFIH